jgi:hypothetical protein
MPDELDVAYGSDGLRTGASGLTSASEITDAATAKLQGAQLAASMFGRTPGCGGFAGAVESARSAQARGFRRESDRSGVLSQGTATAGDLGDILTAGTTALAANVRGVPAA